MQKLTKILEEIRPDVDFDAETALIDDEVLDSFDIISIISEINVQYDIEINVDDLLPENFNSKAAIFDLITRERNG